jgi:hypothetical protein
MREAVQRRLTVEGPQLLTPFPLFLVEGWEFLFPAFLDGELKSKGQPAASQPRPRHQGLPSIFELQGDTETSDAGCSTEAPDFHFPIPGFLFMPPGISWRQLVSLGERAGSAAGAAVSRSWLTHKTVLIS